MKIKSDLFRNKKNNPFHDKIINDLVICYRITAIQMYMVQMVFKYEKLITGFYMPLFQLKPVYSLGKWWKWNISVMGFIYRVYRVVKALWIFLSETINFLRNLHKTDIRVMYIAPSSGHISLNFNMPFKLILRRVEVVFWCLEWECCTVWKIYGNSFKSTNTILWLY